MALMAAISLAFIACSQVMSGDPGADFGPGAAIRKAGGQQVGQPSKWTLIPSPPFDGMAGVTTINGVASDGTDFVAVAGDGSSGYSATASGNNITSWTKATSLPANFTRNPSVVNFVGASYLVTAGNTLTNGAFSTNGGGSWTQTGTIGFGTKASIFASGLYVVAGQNGQGAFSGALTTSFTTIPLVDTGWPASSGPDAYINTGAYGLGSTGTEPLFVFGGGSNYIAYTPTIATGSAITPWTEANTNPFDQGEFINVIVFGNGTFVAVGGPDSGLGRAAYSTDGIDWTQSTNFTLGGTDAAVYALAYGAYDGTNYFVAGDDLGRIAYSTDGTSWSNPIPVFASGVPINAIAYGSGKFVAVGGKSAGGPQAAYTP
jgi:hypothetical protein